MAESSCDVMLPGAKTLEERVEVLEKSVGAFVGCMSVLDAVLRAIGEDGHVFGSRPCETCRVVTAIAGRSFGCIAFAEKRARKAGA